MQEFTADGSEFDVDYLTCALRLAESLHGEAHLEITEAITLHYVEAGQLERGVELAEQIPDAYARDSLLAVITAKAVASEEEDYATELLETIEDPILHNSAIEKMAIEFARRGEFEAALGLTDQLEDNASALGTIAVLYWQSGQKNEALELARSIEFAQESAIALVQLARLSDDNEEGLNLLAEARSVAEEIDSAELKVFALIAIASGYEERAEREQSLETLNRAFEVCEDFESGNLVGLSADFARDEALMEIVQGLIRLQDLSKATDVAEAIDDRFLFARANLGLAVARGKDSQPTEAAAYLDEARSVVVELQPYGAQEAEVLDALIIDLAMSYANYGNYDEARRIIHSLTSEEKQRLVLNELGKLCGRAGHDLEISEIAEDLRSPYDKARYWLGIYDSTSQPELSESAMAKVLASAEGVEQPVEKAEVFTGIALRLAKSQRSPQAENYFLAATTSATFIEGSFLKARAFLRLAKASQDAGRNPNQNEQRLLEQVLARL
jgi:tetratricopeptide (TPR) repeat protein